MFSITQYYYHLFIKNIVKLKGGCVKIDKSAVQCIILILTAFWIFAPELTHFDYIVFNKLCQILTAPESIHVFDIQLLMFI